MIDLTSARLWGAVQSCRRVWHDDVIYYKNKTGRFMLQEQFSIDPELRDKLLSRLAKAGANLFQAIFFPPNVPGQPDRYACLRRIGERLREETQRKSMWIRVTSDDFYAPWNLIYSHKLDDPTTGKGARPDGFWGFQHLIEHVPRYAFRRSEFLFGTPLQVALQLDEEIDKKLGVDCNDLVKNHLKSYLDTDIVLKSRNCAHDFAAALKADAMSDHILYFCCHAEVEGEANVRAEEPYFRLTDQTGDSRITPSILGQMLNGTKFKKGPIVFLNACQTAQMNSVFYQGFVPVFIGSDASTIIGTQTEISAVFAGRFAKLFFEDFLNGGVAAEGVSRRPIGEILFELRRACLGEPHWNPLGMLYSIYRGADVFLEKALRKKAGEISS